MATFTELAELLGPAGIAIASPSNPRHQVSHSTPRRHAARSGETELLASVRQRMKESRLDKCASPPGTAVLLHGSLALGTIATAGDVLPVSPSCLCRTAASFTFSPPNSRIVRRYNRRLRQRHQRPNYLGSHTLNLRQDADLEGDNLRGEIARAQRLIRSSDKRARCAYINAFDSPTLFRDACLVKLDM
jgi:hypothetical protein